MSLVLNSREVAVSTMVGLQKTQRKDDVIRGLSCFYAQSEDNPKPKSQFCDENRNMVGGSDKLVRVSDSGKMKGFCLEEGCESSGSSSIGVADSSCTSTDEVDDGSSDAEVQSKLKSPLSSMDSLEESLPIKRGLSNFFAGKSKSFTSLSEASTVKDLAKPENAFNKRKRSLMICKRGFYTPQSSSYCNLLSPDFALEETEEEGETSENCPNVLPIQARRKLKCFTSPRSFSLTDLQRQGS